MKTQIFRGKKRWEKLEDFLKALPKGYEVCTYGCWPSKKGKPVLYIEYTVP